ncbi:hypothetical protein M8818_004071 [Zalaria obscura]|uniref:Uncharacterized protein n=1 Tax=Zalaria obscura TaxID=2024903 RepID=A0ACC3SEM4_9PEZI
MDYIDPNTREALHEQKLARLKLTRKRLLEQPTPDTRPHKKRSPSPGGSSPSPSSSPSTSPSSVSSKRKSDEAKNEDIDTPQTKKARGKHGIIQKHWYAPVPNAIITPQHAFWAPFPDGPILSDTELAEAAAKLPMITDDDIAALDAMDHSDLYTRSSEEKYVYPPTPEKKDLLKVFKDSKQEAHNGAAKGTIHKDLQEAPVTTSPKDLTEARFTSASQVLTSATSANIKDLKKAQESPKKATTSSATQAHNGAVSSTVQQDLNEAHIMDISEESSKTPKQEVRNKDSIFTTTIDLTSSPTTSETSSAAVTNTDMEATQSAKALPLDSTTYIPDEKQTLSPEEEQLEADIANLAKRVEETRIEKEKYPRGPNKFDSNNRYVKARYAYKAKLREKDRIQKIKAEEEERRIAEEERIERERIEKEQARLRAEKEAEEKRQKELEEANKKKAEEEALRKKEEQRLAKAQGKKEWELLRKSGDEVVGPGKVWIKPEITGTYQPPIREPDPDDGLGWEYEPFMLNNGLIVSLDEDMDAKIDEALSHRSHTSVLAKTVEGVELTRRDFAKLLDGRGWSQGEYAHWLNDELVNAWFASICAKLNENAGYVKGPNAIPPFVAYSSAWLKTFKDKGPSGLATWSRRKGIKNEKLLQANKIFFPVNPGGHWTLLVISPKDRTIEYLDSLHGNNDPYFRMARDWLKMELGAKYVAGEWTEMETASASQRNSTDCGMFTCMNGLALAKGFEEPWRVVNQVSIPFARRMMAAVLLNGGFSGPFNI